jgi:hypothetical protein
LIRQSLGDVAGAVDGIKRDVEEGIMFSPMRPGLSPRKIPGALFLIPSPHLHDMELRAAFFRCMQEFKSDQSFNII